VKDSNFEDLYSVALVHFFSSDCRKVNGKEKGMGGVKANCGYSPSKFECT